MSTVVFLWGGRVNVPAVLSRGTLCRHGAGWFSVVVPQEHAVARGPRPDSPCKGLFVILDSDSLSKTDQPGGTGARVLPCIFITHKSSAINIPQPDHHQAGSVAHNL